MAFQLRQMSQGLQTGAIYKLPLFDSNLEMHVINVADSEEGRNSQTHSQRAYLDGYYLVIDTLRTTLETVLPQCHVGQTPEAQTSFKLLEQQVLATLLELRSRYSQLIQSHSMLQEMSSSADPMVAKTQEQLAKLLSRRDQHLMKLEMQSKEIPKLKEKNDVLVTEKTALQAKLDQFKKSVDAQANDIL
jgi:hypothetical protein